MSMLSVILEDENDEHAVAAEDKNVVTKHIIDIVLLEHTVASENGNEE